MKHTVYLHNARSGRGEVGFQWQQHGFRYSLLKQAIRWWHLLSKSESGAFHASYVSQPQLALSTSKPALSRLLTIAGGSLSYSRMRQPSREVWPGCFQSTFPPRWL